MCPALVIVRCCERREDAPHGHGRTYPGHYPTGPAGGDEASLGTASEDKEVSMSTKARSAYQDQKYIKTMAAPFPAFNPDELTRQREAQQREQQRQAWIQFHRDQAALHARFADEAEDEARWRAHN